MNNTKTIIAARPSRAQPIRPPGDRNGGARIDLAILPRPLPQSLTLPLILSQSLILSPGLRP
ncbi:MAG: hypothetical protein ABFS37_09320 [Acidobacteriota bacterium]